MTPDEHADLRSRRVAAARRAMPPVFAEAILDTPDAADWCHRMLSGEDRNLLLTGTVGTGKTHTAWACWPYLLTAGWVGTWTALTEQQFLDTHLPGGIAEDGQRAYAADLLLLDDVGAVKASDWSRGRVAQLIDARWQHRRPIIVTTNLSANWLAAHLGERAVSRLAAHATTIRKLGTDRRLT